MKIHKHLWAKKQVFVEKTKCLFQNLHAECNISEIDAFRRLGDIAFNYYFKTQKYVALFSNNCF